MTRFKIFFILIVLAVLILPLSASAFWFFDKPATKITTPINNSDLSSAEKSITDAKYKIWYDSFEKKDIQAVITNQKNYYFSINELNYLFNSENGKQKNPLLSNFKLVDDSGILSVSADFKKIIHGNFSFNVQIVNDNNKIKLNISKLKLYGFPIPAYFISSPLNKSLDDYFSFLYKDARYQSFTLDNNNGVLKLNLGFK